MSENLEKRARRWLRRRLDVAVRERLQLLLVVLSRIGRQHDASVSPVADASTGSGDNEDGDGGQTSFDGNDAGTFACLATDRSSCTYYPAAVNGCESGSQLVPSCPAGPIGTCGPGAQDGGVDGTESEESTTLFYCAGAYADANPVAIQNICLSAGGAYTAGTAVCPAGGGPGESCLFQGVNSGGSTGAGGQCMFNTDCAPSATPGGSAVCATTGSAFIGVCVQTTTGKSGDTPCATSIADNDIVSGESSFSSLSPDSGSPPAKVYNCRQSNGVYCSFDTQACTPLGAVGDACSGDSQCQLADHCDTTHHCAAGAAAGNPCSSAGACSSNTCTYGCCSAP